MKQDRCSQKVNSNAQIKWVIFFVCFVLISDCSPDKFALFSCTKNKKPTCISHVCESIWSWEWILFADLPGKESGQKSLCGSSRQATWVETPVTHMESMCSLNTIEYCPNSCCKFVYVRLDIAVNQCIRRSLTNLQTGLEFQQQTTTN